MQTIRDFICIVEGNGHGPGWDGATLDHPSILYHHTSAKNRDSILRHGLDARHSYAAQAGGQDYDGGGGIYFSSVPGDGGDVWDVWAVDVASLRLERDQTTEHEHLDQEWWVSYEQDHIPAARLKLVQQN
jgi:hypothetical protein